MAGACRLEGLRGHAVWGADAGAVVSGACVVVSEFSEIAGRACSLGWWCKCCFGLSTV